MPRAVTPIQGTNELIRSGEQDVLFHRNIVFSGREAGKGTPWVSAHHAGLLLGCVLLYCQSLEQCLAHSESESVSNWVMSTSSRHPWTVAQPPLSLGFSRQECWSGIFPTQGSNPHLLPYRWILYNLNHTVGEPKAGWIRDGSPYITELFSHVVDEETEAEKAPSVIQ